ncbi:MAG TPA: archaeosortase/exosortase family protein [Cellvibrio sp.]|nr:archaeosortase/exosortase family protein [Cellvibrio sp.]
MDLGRNFSGLAKAIPLFAAILAVALLYSPSLTVLWKKWILWDQDLAHSIPTLGVMLALLARRTYVVAELKPKKNATYWLLLSALAICSLGWYLFESLSISLPAYFMLIAVLCLFISTSFSTQLTLAILPTLGLLIFVIPVWSDLTGVLVELSSFVVGHAVKLSHLTVLLEGSSIFLPSGTIYIADGCSGIRYLIISLLMGYILILLNQYKLRNAIATLAIAGLLGLIANWLRIYLLVVIGYHSEMQSSLMHDHETFGWIVFACILIPAIYFSPVSKTANPIIHIPKRVSFLPLLPLAIGPALLYLGSTTTSTNTPLNINHLSQYKIASNERIGIALHPKITHADGQTVEIDQLKIRVDLFTNTPAEPRKEIVPFIGSLTDRNEWLLEQSPKAAPENFDIGIYKQVGGTSRIIIAKQYIVGTMHTDSYLEAKLIQIVAKAMGDSYFGLLTAQANCATDCTTELAIITGALPRINRTQ